MKHQGTSRGRHAPKPDPRRLLPPHPFLIAGHRGRVGVPVSFASLGGSGGNSILAQGTRLAAILIASAARDGEPDAHD
jgi:hypothetical protein